MPSQTLMFVVLPNGAAQQKKLRLSVYLSPRLEGGATLGAFGDFVAWPAQLAHGLRFTLQCGSAKATVKTDPHVLRPDIWKSIFAPHAPVDGYTIGDLDQRLLVTYPSRDAMRYVKYAYQAAGGGRMDYRGLQGLLGDLIFRGEDGKSSLDDEMAQARVALWRKQLDATDGGIPTTGSGGISIAAAEMPRGPVRAAAPPPDGIGTSLTPPANAHDMATQFALYHNMPAAPNRPPLPSTAKEFEQLVDFHKALTALSSYPSLLRALGLVFDLEVPESLCPASPSGGNYGTVAITEVLPGFRWKVAPKLVTPATAYRRSGSSFEAAPATSPNALASGQYAMGDVVQGLLALQADTFFLSQVDLDGALLKALGLAENVASTTASVVGDTLPALRSSGLGVFADQRALQLLLALVQGKAFDDALTSAGTLPRPLIVTDVIRGYRIDIWDSLTRKWHSLHRRDATYRFGADGALVETVPDEEGFLQPAVAQPADDPTRPPDPVSTANGIPQPGTDLFVHERVTRWDGWSLSAPRPGTALNRSPDPALATTPDPTEGQPVTPFKMTTSFRVRQGSLPELRFGRQYRIRARAVDLAGNSIALATPTPSALALPPGGVTLRYRRFEPVAPPLVVLRGNPAVGGSLERLVIRSFNHSPELDTVPVADTDERHIGPPRGSVEMAERLGVLDDPDGKLRADAATYAMITTRDSYEIPTAGGTPMEPGETLAVSYLPDVLARGAAWRNLPNTVDNTSGHAGGGGLAYYQSSEFQPRQGSVTYVAFGTAWPGRSAFRVAIIEGTAAPAWDDARRVLSVSLPKSLVAEVPLSSFVDAADLEIMGVWNWLREHFEAAEQAAVSSTFAEFQLTNVSDTAALITRQVLEAGHPMITPSRMLTLVHAVQQPLGHPAFVQLPVVHRATAPILASALRNSFTPITAWRSPASHFAVLLGGLKVHAASSSKIDLEARVLEVTDDLAKPGPAEVWQGHHVETIKLDDTNPTFIQADASDTPRLVATYIPEVDTLWFSAPFDELDGVLNPGEVSAPLHRFDDTKHRWVKYQAIATSRFQEYFPANASLDFTRAGEALVVDVPSSARPTAADIAYVVPTFGWQQEETTNVKASVRFGNGLRVYLRRPWYSSGADELLGVVLWSFGHGDPDAAARERYKPYFTQWGNDPIWKSGGLNQVPQAFDFPRAVDSASALTLAETDQPFDVAGHAVAYDAHRRLWYCDIEVDNPTVYAPFVRLALVRYQPHSIQGEELSRVVLADFAQLTPNRSSVLSIDPVDPRHARLYVGGPGPDAPRKNVVSVSVERRMPHVATDMGWEAVPASVVVVTEDAPTPDQPDAVLWAGGIAFAQPPPPGEFRVVVREYERLPVDIPIFDINVGVRLVYAAIISYEYTGKPAGLP